METIQTYTYYTASFTLFNHTLVSILSHLEYFCTKNIHQPIKNLEYDKKD